MRLHERSFGWPERVLLLALLSGALSHPPPAARGDVVTLDFSGGDTIIVFCGTSDSFDIRVEGVVDTAPSRELFIDLFIDGDQRATFGHRVFEGQFSTRFTITAICSSAPECLLTLSIDAGGEEPIVRETFGSFAKLSARASLLGSASARSTDDPTVICVDGSSVPEPYGLALMSTGLACLLGCSWLKRFRPTGGRPSEPMASGSTR